MRTVKRFARNAKKAIHHTEFKNFEEDILADERDDKKQGAASVVDVLGNV